MLCEALDHSSPPSALPKCQRMNFSPREGSRSQTCHRQLQINSLLLYLHHVRAKWKTRVLRKSVLTGVTSLLVSTWQKGASPATSVTNFKKDEVCLALHPGTPHRVRTPFSKALMKETLLRMWLLGDAQPYFKDFPPLMRTRMQKHIVISNSKRIYVCTRAG